jgi:phosphatidylinositol transfer protein SFH5
VSPKRLLFLNLRLRSRLQTPPRFVLIQFLSQSLTFHKSTAEAPASAETKVEKSLETGKTTPIQELWLLAKAHGHQEIWGVQLADPETHVPSQIVFQKYLNANDGDLTKAKDQLKKTLDWRKENQPLEKLQKKHAAKKFDGLGYVTTYGSQDGGTGGKEVFTWNVYGIVKDLPATFGDVKE